MDGLFKEIAGERFASLRRKLDALGANPPQVLLLDGGVEEERVAAALYWACRVNCPSADELGHPCLACDTCRQVADRTHMDVLAYDGRISNKDDETDPGPVRALSVANARELKGKLRTAPHGDGLRVVLLAGLEHNRDESANALLKALEEPSETTLFVILTAQRQQLLPTLVSRSHCVILPWPDPETEHRDARDEEIAADVETFLKCGQRMMVRTASKGFDAKQAERVLSLVEKAVLRLLSGSAQGTGLDAQLAVLSRWHLTDVSRWVAEARVRLAGQGNPARVVDALMSTLFVTVQENRS